VNTASQSRLEELVATRLAQEQPAAVVDAGTHAARRFGNSVRAVLFYGSGLRDREIAGKILDFYVLVEDYETAFDKPWLAKATHLLPPSVFYDENEFASDRLRSKVNVVSLADFAQRARSKGSDITIWARFAQPAALLLCHDEAAARIVRKSVVAAVRRMLAEALPFCSRGADAQRVWTTALSLTYGAELRAEPPGKAEELFAADANYYEELFSAALPAMGVALEETAGEASPRLAEAPMSAERRRAAWRWRKRRFLGKAGSLLRLIKAAFTFDGGIDYLAWKIERHSGVPVQPTPWQRRHPILGGLTLFLRLRRRGAFR